jgi:hypothetical protein
VRGLFIQGDDLILVTGMLDDADDVVVAHAVDLGEEFLPANQRHVPGPVLGM